MFRFKKKSFFKNSDKFGYSFITNGKVGSSHILKIVKSLATALLQMVIYDFS